MQFIISFSALLLALVMGTMPAQAFVPKETSRYFNGPSISQVTDTKATVSISDTLLFDITEDEKRGLYFEYGKTNQVCIMIYPTPEACLPKKTQIGSTTVVLENLQPETSYTIKYKRDNTIRCITTPCPGNEYESLSVEFVTKAQQVTTTVATGSTMYSFLRNLWVGSRGDDVTILQSILKEWGYFDKDVTGYFGGITMKSLRAFQKDNNISPTGYFGPLTRQSIKEHHHKRSEKGGFFEGIVTAYSTACFADGECSITVDGKKVVTTIGWSQAVVGKVLGIPDFGSIENNLGAHAKVYAKKTDDGYTLYGDTDYYIKITPKSGKLQPGSVPVESHTLQSVTWTWQKTVMTDGTTVTPNKAGAFTLIFSPEGNISGKTDCNGFFGSYTLGSDGFVKFGPLGSTLMFCDGSQEQVFTSTVAKVDRYSFDASGNLLLLLSGNEGTVYFYKK